MRKPPTSEHIAEAERPLAQSPDRVAMQRRITARTPETRPRRDREHLLGILEAIQTQRYKSHVSALTPFCKAEARASAASRSSVRWLMSLFGRAATVFAKSRTISANKA